MVWIYALSTWRYIAGSGLRYDENIRWPARMRKALGDAYEVEEEGLSGRAAVYDDPISPYKNGYTYLAPCLLTDRPIDLLIIMLGTNDFKSHMPGKILSEPQGECSFWWNRHGLWIAAGLVKK